MMEIEKSVCLAASPAGDGGADAARSGALDSSGDPGGRAVWGGVSGELGG